LLEIRIPSFEEIEPRGGKINLESKGKSRGLAVAVTLINLCSIRSIGACYDADSLHLGSEASFAEPREFARELRGIDYKIRGLSAAVSVNVSRPGTVCTPRLQFRVSPSGRTVCNIRRRNR